MVHPNWWPKATNWKKKRTGEPPEITMWRAAFHRANKLGLPFNLELSDICIPEKCPVLGLVLSRKGGNASPTLDKIIPELGYVKGNVAVISHKANRLKSNATLRELKLLVAYIENHECKAT